MEKGRRKPGLRSDYALFRTIETRWEDNDIYGHMNNAVHFRLFDTVINGFEMDNELFDLTASKGLFYVVETGCRYHGELAHPDTVWAGLRIARIGSSSIKYELGLFRNDADDAAAEGHFVHVHVDRENRKPLPLSPRSREILEQLVVR